MDFYFFRYFIEILKTKLLIHIYFYFFFIYNLFNLIKSFVYYEIKRIKRFDKIIDF